MDTKELLMTARIARNCEIVTADMDGEIVMMSIKNGKYYNLGKMGTVIWNFLETPLSTEEIIQKLRETYDVEKEQCEKEVYSFLSNLVQENIIVIK